MTTSIYRLKVDLGFKPMQKSKKKHNHPRSREIYNTEQFYDFIMGICEEALPNKPDNFAYYAPAISCNESTLEYIREHINPMDYLNVSPTLDATLEDFEFQVDNDKLLEEKK